MGRKIADLQVEDADGEAWKEEIGQRNAAQARRRPDQMGEPLVAPPLPDFRANVPVLVSREVFGRFLQDPASGIVHDLYNATSGCGIDEIRDAVFFHFWSEVPGDVAPCDLCLP